jgi:hypothetical protein
MTVAPLRDPEPLEDHNRDRRKPTEERMVVEMMTMHPWLRRRKYPRKSMQSPKSQSQKSLRKWARSGRGMTIKRMKVNQRKRKRQRQRQALSLEARLSRYQIRATSKVSQTNLTFT